MMNANTDDDDVEMILAIESITENPAIKGNYKYRQYILKTAEKALKLPWPIKNIYIWLRFTGHRDIIGPKLVRKLRSLPPEILFEVGKDPIPRPPSSTKVGSTIFFLASQTHEALAPIIEESSSFESSEKSDEMSSSSSRGGGLLGDDENSNPPALASSSSGGNNNSVYAFANVAADRRLFTIEEDDYSGSRQSTGIEVTTMSTGSGTSQSSPTIQVFDGSFPAFDEEEYSASVGSSFTESSSLAELSHQATDGSDQHDEIM